MLYAVFLWAPMALNGPLRRFWARADVCNWGDGVPHGTHRYNQVFLGDGARGFTDASESAQYVEICRLACTDKNDDGAIDDCDSGYVTQHVLDADLNGGAPASFSPPTALRSNSRDGLSECGICLLATDGHIDLFITIRNADNRFFAGDGAGGFSPVVNGATPTSETRIASIHTSAADFNGASPPKATANNRFHMLPRGLLPGDGHLDLYTVAQNTGSNKLFISDGNGDFVGQNLDPWSVDLHSAIADLNGSDTVVAVHHSTAVAACIR